MSEDRLLPRSAASSEPSWQRVLVLAVHPDDESLGAGGAIQHALERGADVRVIVITDGENNPWPQRYLERRWRIDAAARTRWGARRRAEATAALSGLGVSAENISFWHYPDLGLTPLLLAGGEEFIQRLAREITGWRPTVLVAPSMRDLHPDHSAVAVLLHFTTERLAFGAPPPFTVLEYLVHAREAKRASVNFQLTLAPEQVARKRAAILQHATQMALSRRRFLAFATATEIFFDPARPAPADSAHPVMSARFSDDSLCLRLQRLAGRTTLLLAAENPDGGIFRQAIKLFSGAELSDDDERGGEFQTYARIVRAADADEVFLPAAFFASVRWLAVKLQVDRGFYDHAGWRLIPLEALAHSGVARAGELASAARVCCVIPCYNLADVCGPIVRAAATLADHVIAVDDGSDDETGCVLRAVVAEMNGRVELVSLPRNRGKGIALLEAFRHALQTVNFDFLITLDGDGQHRPEDIRHLARAIAQTDDALIIGERLARAKMPLRSRLGNTLTAALIKLFYRDAPTDTQSGFRAFRWEFVQEIVSTIAGGRYETELEILLLALQRRRRLGSVTIPTIYLDGNRSSHFRPLRDSWRIYRTLFRFRFGGTQSVGQPERTRSAQSALLSVGAAFSDPATSPAARSGAATRAGGLRRAMRTGFRAALAQRPFSLTRLR